jgi:carboxyl-terminal processing protease
MVAVLVVLSMSVGALIGSGANPGIDATASTRLTQIPEFQLVEETYDAIRENYVLSNDISDEELIYGASSGMVDALGDEGHSTFLNPKEADDFEKSSRGELTGVGIQIDLTGPQPIIVAPIDGSPAFEAGIRSGDVIIAVDGVMTADIDSDDVADMIRGEAGTEVTLTLRHQDELEPYDVTITRAKIDIKPVSYAMLPNDVLWLRLSQFSTGATEGVTEALRFGKSQGMTGVILDLRNNPGGLVFEAIGVGSQFLPGGSVLYQEQNPDGTVREVQTIGNDGEWQAGNLVVVINEGSASAAEIVSSGIGDNGRGTLYGETTFGTGTVLLPIELDGGSVALLGTKLWLTADGAVIWKKGVDPDTVITLEPGVSPRLPIEYETDILTDQDIAALEDAQLLTAYEELVTGGG